jgi:hypothetical protein
MIYLYKFSLYHSHMKIKNMLCMDIAAGEKKKTFLFYFLSIFLSFVLCFYFFKLLIFFPHHTYHFCIKCLLAENHNEIESN